MTMIRDSRYWLGIVAEHYGSLLITAIAHGAVKQIDDLNAEIIRLRSGLEAARVYGELVKATQLVADITDILKDQDDDLQKM